MSHPIDDEPLSLAVHSLPSPQEAASERAVVSGRWKLLAIMFLCSLPVVAAYFAYFVVRPQGKGALGELIQPVRPVEAQQAISLDGKPVALATLKGQWLLVSTVTQACDAGCQQRLFLHHQLRETLNKDKDRVDWIVLLGDAQTLPAPVQPLLKDATVMQVHADVFAQWLVPATGKQVDEHLYVVDPLGNTMMRFPAAFDGAGAAKARKDLDRLLRASLNWDPPGR